MIVMTFINPEMSMHISQVNGFLLGYYFHQWCPDGRAGGRVGGGKKIVRLVSQKPLGVGS